MTAEDTSKEYCRTIFDILLAKGVKNIVLSPGSRNAPLLIAAACRPFRRRIIIDERAAAFTALGISLASNAPVAIVCTSGTALYDYAPAIAEAFYQHVPLIVITADRPAEWIDQDDSQTLIQPGALAKIVKGSFDIPVHHRDNSDEPWYVNRIINEACNLALSRRRGPVHINIRLNNPLGDTVPYSPSQPRVIENIDNTDLLPHIYKQLAGELQGKRIMLTAGFMQPDNALNRAVSAFASLPSVVSMCETISNLHLPGNPYAVDTPLSLLESGACSDSDHTLQPDVVISIGGALVSRKLKEFLRKNPPAEHWTLGDTSPATDCFKCLTRHFEVSPTRFFKALTRHLSKLNQSSASIAEYTSRWQELRHTAADSHDRYLQNNSEWSEMTAFRHILENLPSSFNLFLSNGTPVRYAQLFSRNLPHASFACRGVSGIDGTTATAIGCALSYKGPTLLITGDMSMAYDTDVLAISDIPSNFKIVVINNSGGGIFRFIPTTRNLKQRDELFCAAPRLPLRQLADAYDWKYFEVDSLCSLETQYAALLASEQKSILEIKTNGDFSASILLNYMTRK